MRIRTIKPEFWMHEGICLCSDFTRLLAIALLNWSDDEGYFMANPILIRGQVFPFLDDSKIIPRSLQDLSRVGWITLGKDNQGRDVGMIKNFAKHQRVDKPKPSCIKGNFQFQDDSKIDPRLIQDASKEEWKGMEGKGIGKEKTDPHQNTESEARGTIDQLRSFAAEIGLPESDGESMFHHWESNGWKNGSSPSKNWKSGIRKWKSQGWLPSQKNPINGKPKTTSAAQYGI